MIFITSNKNKVKEIKELATSKTTHIIIEHKEYDYPELQLDEIELIAKESANYIRVKAKTKIEKPFFIEDSGLFIHTLNGFPGPYSSYVFKKIGNKGILKLMLGTKEEERNATFKSVVAFCESQRKEPILFGGTVEGRIAEEIRGEEGFGYDPIFEFEGKTFGEMSVEKKNEVSHRGRAFRKLLDYINILI